MTAAMCQGNKLERVRDDFPTRFFDTGICESHAVAFAAGQAKAGLRPIVDIYSTFLQRSYRPDLPGSCSAESAGDVPARSGRPDRTRRADAPRHLRPGLHAAVSQYRCHGSRRRSGSGRDARFRPGARPARSRIRYPKATAERIDRSVTPIELGRAEVLEWGQDGMIVACGTLLPALRQGGRTIARTKGWTSA